MPSIQLQSKDNEVFAVDLEVAKRSVTLANMLENLGIEDADSEVPVPVGNVDSAILKKIIEWCAHHKDDPEPSEDENDNTKIDIPSWDQDFFKVDQETLFMIIRAANFLEIKGLLDMGCMTVANLIKTQTSGEGIRKMFNLKNDFTPEEEEQVKKENKWCEEK